MRKARRRAAWACVGLVLALGGSLQAQVRRPPAREPQAADLSPAEVQRLFDAYAIVQAQDMLQLNDAQYAQFVTRLKDLQETRRFEQRERAELMQGLARLTAQDPPADDGLLRERLRALAEHDARAAASQKKAYEAIDQVLTVVQQARFRVFEEQMERRKLQLLLRARQARRP